MIHVKRVNLLLTTFEQSLRMLVSHSCRFILFPDPMGACPWIAPALCHWLDQPVAPNRSAASESHLFADMSPLEAELAFDMMGLAFRSYAKIAIVQNPYVKMARLYDKIAATDRVWQMRCRLGGRMPDYARWLRNTRPDGHGAGNRLAPRWRRFGAWSAKTWCGDRINHVVRAETAEHELVQIFGKIGIAPEFQATRTNSRLLQKAPRRNSPEVDAIMRARYGWDLALYGESGSETRLAA